MPPPQDRLEFRRGKTSTFRTVLCDRRSGLGGHTVEAPPGVPAKAFALPYVPPERLAAYVRGDIRDPADTVCVVLFLVATEVPEGVVLRGPASPRLGLW